jgi:ERO1-like protein alpha
MQAAFRNVTAVMDCVGCEKCRLWGKLQLLGVAAALKVLVSDTAVPSSPAPLTLERNEAVALVNLFDRLARSVATVAALEARLEGGEEPAGPVVMVDGHHGGTHADLAAAFGF